MKLKKENVLRLEQIQRNIIEEIKDAELIISFSDNSGTIRDANEWLNYMNMVVGNAVFPGTDMETTINNLWDDLYL